MKLSKIFGVACVLVGCSALMSACGDNQTSSDVEQASGEVSAALLDFPSNGGVITIAGTGTKGAADAIIGTNGTLNDPAAVAVRDSDGSIFVADWGNNSIRRITNDGRLETYVNGQPNLLLNPRAEGGSSGWTFGAAGAWSSTSKSDCSACGNPLDGTRFFYGVGTAPTWTNDDKATQTISATALAPYSSDIAAGNIAFVYLAGQRSAGAPRLALDFYSGSTRFLEGPKQTGGATDIWQRGLYTAGLAAAGPQGFRQLPTQTTSVRAFLGAPSQGAYFDAIQFRVSKIGTPLSQDAGLVGPSALAVASKPRKAAWRRSSRTLWVGGRSNRLEALLPI